jgi:hypothetical protein
MIAAKHVSSPTTRTTIGVDYKYQQFPAIKHKTSNIRFQGPVEDTLVILC